MTKVYPLYNDKQITDGWDMDRWEDDGGRSISTAKDSNRH